MGRGMRIFNAAVKQYQFHQENTNRIKAAKEKTEREKQDYEIDKKLKTLELEKAKRSGNLGELDYKAQKAQFDEYYKQHKARMEGITAQQNIAEKQEMTYADNARFGAIKVAPQAKQEYAQEQLLESSQQMGGMQTYPKAGELIYKGGGKFERTKQKAYKDSKEYLINKSAENILKDLNSNDTYNKLSIKEKSNLAKKYAQELHGNGSAQPKKKLELPETIKTRRQAILHLMNKEGMSEEEATNLLKQN